MVVFAGFGKNLQGMDVDLILSNLGKMRGTVLAQRETRTIRIVSASGCADNFSRAVNAPF